jgi:hypothetical protein
MRSVNFEASAYLQVNICMRNVQRFRRATSRAQGRNSLQGVQPVYMLLILDATNIFHGVRTIHQEEQTTVAIDSAK